MDNGISLREARVAEDLQTRFLKLHMSRQRVLFSYLLAAVRDPATAEDLLQQVTLVLWKKFPEYRPEVPYIAWAYGVARREVAAHFRRKSGKETILPLEILDAVAPEIEILEGGLSAESRALAACVGKLAGPMRELLRLRYEERCSRPALASRLGESLAAVNMRIVRVRRALLDCTRRALMEES